MGSSTATLSPVTAVPIADLTVSPLNPRREKKLDAVPLEELAASIRARGILQPLVTRRVGGKLEVIAGRRRLEAARLAGLTEVPVIIRTLDDQEAASAALVENEQRTALRPLDGALAVAKRLEAGESVEAIAAAVGKSPSWVARRANLTKLAPALRKSLEDPEHSIRTWPLAVLELVALLPHDAQEVELARTENWGEMPTVEALKRELANECAELARAPWKLDDALLVPKAGACDRCPNNSANSPNLFGDLELDGEKVAGAVCRNSECWSAKLQAFAADRVKVAAEEHGKELLRIVAPVGDGRNSVTDQKGALAPHQYKRVKQGTKGAKPAVIVSGEGLGKVLHVKVNPGMQRPAATSAKKAKPKPGTKEAEKAATEELALRRAGWVADMVIGLIKKAAAPKPEVVMKLVAVFGADGNRHENLPVLKKQFESATHETVWKDLREYGLTIHYTGMSSKTVRREPAILAQLAWLADIVLGAGSAARLQKEAVEAVPDPKPAGLKQSAAKPTAKKAKKPAPPKKGGRKA